MTQNIDDFFHDFRQELMVGAEANGSFQLSEFIESFVSELVDTGFTDGLEICHYRSPRGMRVDGYWFNDEGALDLFIADFESRTKVESLTKTDVEAAFKRLTNFFESCANKNLASNLEITAPEYGLAKQISDRLSNISVLNLILISERSLSDKVKAIADNKILNIPLRYQVWDISRLQRLRSSRGQKEPLDLNFEELFGKGIPCIAANSISQEYQAYLMVMPGNVLSELYEEYGSRLL